MKPIISVIIPCYNSWEYLPQCMQSLERQTIGLDKLQLIFVDDASTDGGKTWECIMDFERKHPDSVVAIHLDENRCQGGARNVGISYAEGEYLGFIDSDDWIEAEMYERLYHYMEVYHCDIVDSRLIVNLKDGTQCIRDKAPDRLDEFPAATLEGDAHWIDAFSGAAYGGNICVGLYRKDLIVDNQVYFPERLKYEDNYWSSILLLYVKRVYHLASDFYHYRENETSTIHLRNNKHHFDRLEIEERKLERYKELGVYEKFEKEIERDFLKMYYCNTLGMLWSRFDIPPYDVFCKMQERVKQLFPDYKRNPYFQEESVDRMFLGFIDRNLNEAQFIAVGKEIMSWIE